MSALGNLFVNLTLNHAQYTAALTKSEHQAQEFANRSKKHVADFEKSAIQSLANVTKSVVGIGAGLVSFNALKATFDKAVSQLDQIDKIAQKTGSSFGELSRQQQALARAGEDFTAAYAAGLNKLSQNLGKFDDDTSKVLKALGVNSQDATGKLRNAADVSRDVAFALQKYEDGAGKAAAVTALFGKSGVDLIPVLNDLADQYQHVTGVSEKFGKNVQQFNDLMDVASAQSTFLGQSMAVGLLPSLNSIGEGFKKVGFDAGNFGQIIGEGLGRVLRVTAATVTGFVAVVSGAGAAVKALISGDFGNIGNAFTAASGKYDGMIKSFLNGGGVIEQATSKIEKQKLSLEGLVVKSDSAGQATQRLAKAQKEQISDADRFLQSLNKEVETLNKNTFEIKKLEASKLGLSKVADPLIDKIQRETEAHKKQADALQKGISITQQMRTKEEQFSDTQKELNDLLKGGAITQETYNRALSKAGEELKKVENKAADAFPKMEEFAIQASRNIQNAFSNSIRLGLDGDFKGMVASFKAALLQMVAEAAALDLAGAIFGKSNNQGSFLANMLGLKGGTGGGLSLGKTAGGLLGFLGLSGGSSPAMAFTGQSFLGGAGTALGGQGLSGGGLSSLSSIGGTLAGAGIGIGIGSMIGGNKKVGGIGSGLLSTGGAALGGVVGGPIGAAIGGILGGAIAGLFGRGPLKQKETNLIGEFGVGGFDGTTSTKFKAQGGLLVGDKVVRIVADTQTGEVISGASGKLQAAATEAGKLAQQVGKFITGQWLPIIDGFKQVSEKMGIAKEAMEGFNFQINIASEKGKALTQEQIGEKISEAADNLARRLMPEIDSLKEGAETAAQAFDRLSVEFDSLITFAVTRGIDLAEATKQAKNASVKDRSALFDQIGIKDLGVKADSFIKNFGGADINSKILSDQITEIIKPFGASLGDVDTKQELVKIYQSVDISTDVGRQILKALLDNQDLFLAYADQQSSTLDPQSLLGEAFANLQASVDAERTAATNRFNRQLKVIDDRIAGLVKSAAKLLTLSDGLKSTSRDIRGITTGEARSNIIAAIEDAKKGLFPDLADLQPSLNALRSITDSGFSNRTEFERSKASNANLIDQLGSLTDTQLDATDKLLENAEDQRNALVDGFEREMFRLDNILSAAQKEIELITGTNKILLDVSTALKAFASATGAVKAGGGGAKPSAAAVLGGAGNQAITNQQIKDYISKAKSNDDILQAAIANGVSAMQVATAMNNQGGFTLDNIRQFAASRGITGFANGGIHTGGYRIVGERGPELEYTPPSRIHSTADTKQLFDSDGIIESIKTLSNEIRAVATHSKKTSDILIRLTRDGNSLVTTTA